MTAARHILVLRFSAMGDVAMTVPVIKGLLLQHPNLRITYVSRPGFSAFFNDIDRLTFVPADFKSTYKGISGSYRLFKELAGLGQYDAVANLHNNLRSNIIQALFQFKGVTGRRIDKDRAAKKQLTRFPNKVLKRLTLTTERYAEVFRQLGLPLTLSHQLVKTELIAEKDLPFEVKQGYWVGIAPFAQHQGKIYPLGRMEQVVQILNQAGIKLFIFGGSPEEKAVAADWEQKYQHVTSMVNRISLLQELELIARLDLMVAMDSAGMHMASLQGVPVVSIWGATHHFAGFLGYGQQESDIIADTIACRPCSVYGNKPCFRDDYACLYNITPQSIADKVLDRLKEL
ncbi:glycosyltransferase family 9 protein [Mucilaginibacter sp. CSA2-8R]|uniref:glycosyltransferase family 9 protein n=1 Tax=Mucilaginibacter sp. CSA2-8R TaxID=3141542 RepID=UPI00315D54E5